MKRFLCVLMLVGGLLAGPVAVRGASEVEKLLAAAPADALLVVGTSGGTALKLGFEKSLPGQIWADPGVQQFVEQVRQSFEQVIAKEVSGEEQREMIQSVRKMVGTILSRPLLLTVSPSPTVTPESPIITALLIDAGEKKTQIQEILGQLEGIIRRQNSWKQDLIGSLTFGELQVHALGGEEIWAYWGWAGDTLVMALKDPAGTAIQRVRQAGQKPASTSPSILQKVSGTDDLLVFHLDVQGILNLVKDVMGTSGKMSSEDLGRMDTVLDRLGINALRSITTRVGFDEAGVRSESFTVAPEPRKGLLACWRPVDPAALDVVDKDATSVGIMNLDLAGLYDTVYGTLEAVVPPDEMEEVRGAIAAVEAQAGFAIRGDLLGGLDGQVVYYAHAAGTSQGVYPSGVLLAKVKDAGKVEAALTALEARAQVILAQPMQQAGVSFSTQQVQGKTVHVVGWAPMMMFAGIMPCWTVTDEYLIVTTSPTVCGSVLTRLDSTERAKDSIRSVPQVRAILNEVPAGAYWFSYSDPRTDFQFAYAMLGRFYPMGTMLAGQQGVTLPPMLPMIDPLIEKMPPTVQYGWTDAEGFHETCRSAGVGETLGFTAGAALGVSVLMPALDKSRELAKRTECGTQLRGIGQAIALYQNEYNDKNPPDLETLVQTEDLNPKLFICPSDIDHDSRMSYIYRGNDLTSNAPPDMILAHDRRASHNENIVNVLFADMHVEQCKFDLFKQKIQQDNAHRRRLGLPEKDTKGKIIPSSKPAETPAETSIGI